MKKLEQYTTEQKIKYHQEMASKAMRELEYRQRRIAQLMAAEIDKLNKETTKTLGQIKKRKAA